MNPVRALTADMAAAPVQAINSIQPRAIVHPVEDRPRAITGILVGAITVRIPRLRTAPEAAVEVGIAVEAAVGIAVEEVAAGIPVAAVEVGTVVVAVVDPIGASRQ